MELFPRVPEFVNAEISRSLHNPRFNVSDENWLVSIMRKSEELHTFLMLEGRSPFNEVILRRYDLVINENNPRMAKIEIRPNPENDGVVGLNPTGDPLNYFLKNEAYVHRSWNIPKKVAAELHENIRDSSRNPPSYQILGDRSTLAQSSSHEGHSCFTWARERLHELNYPRINLPEEYSNFAGAYPPAYINDDENACLPPCVMM